MSARAEHPQIGAGNAREVASPRSWEALGLGCAGLRSGLAVPGGAASSGGAGPSVVAASARARVRPPKSNTRTPPLPPLHLAPAMRHRGRARAGEGLGGLCQYTPKSKTRNHIPGTICTENAVSCI
eukprot:989824-Rhodomonas_salina.1